MREVPVWPVLWWLPFLGCLFLVSWCLVVELQCSGLKGHQHDLGPKASLQVLQVQRLRDVIEGAQLERLAAGIFFLDRRDHDDAHLLVNLAHVLQDLQAVQLRQAYIQEDEVGALCTACQPAGDPSNASRMIRMIAA